MKLVKLRVKKGYIVHHRDRRATGQLTDGWRSLSANQMFKTDAQDATRLIEEGVAQPARWWHVL